MSLPAGRIYLFDTSIWEHTEHPSIAADWDAALEHNQLAVSPIVAFEVLYTAQNQAQFENLETYLDALRQAPLTQGIVRDARRALHDLSAKTSHDELYAIGRFEFDRSLQLLPGRNRP